MQPIKVLIVDDDPMVGEINKNFTEAVDGFKVVGVARNGREALELCNSKQPQLVILDIYMPEATGLEMLSLLRRKEEAAIDVIMVTAANDGRTIEQVLRYGIFGYIIKPFKFEKYRDVLEKYRNFKRKLQSHPTVMQEDIDQAFAIPAQLRQDIPKNLHVQTLQMLLKHLQRQPGALSAEEVAANTGISRPTARRYLEYLTQQEQVEMVLEYISVGRPIHRYRLKKE